MTDFNPLKWQEIFAQLIEEGHYDVGSVNYYHLTSILEDLYVENQELKSRVETLEKDMELIKSYAWEKMTERNLTQELLYTNYIDMENGDDMESIDYRSLIHILTELMSRIEKLEKSQHTHSEMKND